MFRCRPRILSRKHPGATLVEMLIALIILAVMLLSIMAVMILTTQNAVAAKEGSVVYLTNLSDMEKMEAKQVSGDETTSEPSKLGKYTLDRDVKSSPLRSADIKIKAAWDGVKLKGNVTIERQVSPSAWQNAGQEPKE